MTGAAGSRCGRPGARSGLRGGRSRRCRRGSRGRRCRRHRRPRVEGVGRRSRAPRSEERRADPEAPPVRNARQAVARRSGRRPSRADASGRRRGPRSTHRTEPRGRKREKGKALIGKFRTNQPCGRSGTSGSRLASLACSPPPVHSDQGRANVRQGRRSGQAEEGGLVTLSPSSRFPRGSTSPSPLASRR